MIEIRMLHRKREIGVAHNMVHTVTDDILQYREIIQHTGPIRYDEFNRAIPYGVTGTEWKDVPHVYESEDDVDPYLQTR